MRSVSATTEELVKTLSIPNGWHRDTASRLLYERQDKSAIPLLEQLLSSREETRSLARLHALHALEGLHALKPEHLLTALSDPNEHVRQHAIKLCDDALQSNHALPALVAKLSAMVEDPSLIVRYQLAFTLGYLHNADLPAHLAKIAARDAADPWVAAAVLNSIGDKAVDLFRMLNAPALRRRPHRVMAPRWRDDRRAALVTRSPPSWKSPANKKTSPA